MDFFRDRDTYQRRTWIRRKTPLNKSGKSPKVLDPSTHDPSLKKNPSTEKSPEKTTNATPMTNQQTGKRARQNPGTDAAGDDAEDMEMSDVVVLAAVRPLDFQRQGRSHP